jgi:VWFA-related protein
MDTKDARVGFGFLVASLACCLAIGAVALVAQQTFRATTVFVEVDAIVTDSKGQFITDLTSDDFEVLDEGTPQKVERIYLVNGSSVNAVPGTATAIDDVAARQPAPPAPPQRVFVLVFDQEHMQEGAFKRIREAAITFLTHEFRTGDVGGVVIGSAMAGNQLTSDRDALMAAVRNAKPTAAKTSRRLELFEWPRLSSESEAIRTRALSDDREVLAQAVRRACQDDPSVCRNASPETMVMEKARSIVAELRPAARRTVVALQALASGLGRLPGRKTVILMTEGFFVEESWADLRQIVGAAARSNVRIYSLDARGLDTRQTNDLRQLGVMDAGGGLPLDAYNTIEDGPNVLAVDTGGYPIRRTNTFADALAEIAQDTSRYYVLGYSPSNAPATAVSKADRPRKAPGLEGYGAARAIWRQRRRSPQRRVAAGANGPSRRHLSAASGAATAAPCFRFTCRERRPGGANGNCRSRRDPCCARDHLSSRLDFSGSRSRITRDRDGARRHRRRAGMGSLSERRSRRRG